MASRRSKSIVRQEKRAARSAKRRECRVTDALPQEWYYRVPKAVSPIPDSPPRRHRTPSPTADLSLPPTPGKNLSFPPRTTDRPRFCLAEVPPSPSPPRQCPPTPGKTSSDRGLTSRQAIEARIRAAARKLRRRARTAPHLRPLERPPARRAIQPTTLSAYAQTPEGKLTWLRHQQ